MRRTHSLAFFVGTILAIAAVRSALAGRPGFRALDTVVDGQTFDAVCESLLLSDAQRAVAARAFETYTTAIKALDAESDKNVKAAGSTRCSELVRASLRSGEPLPDEAFVLYRAYRDELLACQAKSDALLEAFLNTIAESLAESQAERMESARRAIRRLNEPVYVSDTDGDTEIVRFPDLHKVVHDAMSEDGELAWMVVPVPNVKQDMLIEARQSVSEALRTYEHDLDGILVERRRMRRAPPAIDEGPIWAEDDPAARRRLREQAESWERHWRAATLARDAIAPAIESVKGSTATLSWSLRWLKAMHPALAQQRLPDRMHEWCVAQESVSDDQRLLLDAIRNEYVTRSSSIVQAVIPLLVAIASGEGAPNASDAVKIARLDREKTSLRTLIDESTARMRSVLAERELQASFDMEWVRLLSSEPRLAGPITQAQVLPLRESPIKEPSGGGSGSQPRQ